MPLLYHQYVGDAVKFERRLGAFVSVAPDGPAPWRVVAMKVATMKRKYGHSPVLGACREISVVIDGASRIVAIALSRRHFACRRLSNATPTRRSRVLQIKANGGESFAVRISSRAVLPLVTYHQASFVASSSSARPQNNIGLMRHVRERRSIRFG